MSKTIQHIEQRERLFRRVLRNQARRFLLRNRHSDVMEALGLFDEEERCNRRGRVYCLLGMDKCYMCYGLIGGAVTPMYDEMVEKLGNPEVEPEVAARSTDPTEEEVGSNSTEETDSKEE